MTGPLPPSLLAEIARASQEGASHAATGTRVRFERAVSTTEHLQGVIAALHGPAQYQVRSYNGSWSFEVPTAAFGLTDQTIGLWHCDEGEGSTLDDETDNANDLTLTDVSWTTGMFSTDGLSFNGASSVGSATLTSAEPVRRYLYFAAWINPTSGPLFQWEDVLEVYIDGGALCAQVEDQTYTGPAITASTWQLAHVQFFDGKVFIGVDDVIWAFDHTDNTLTVGAWTVTVGKRDSSYYSGLMDEIRLVADVVVQEDRGKRHYHAQPDSILYCTFDAGSGTEDHHHDFVGPTVSLVGPSWITGYLGNGLSFDGADDYASFTPGLAATASKLSLHLVVRFDVLDACTLIDQTDGLNLAWDGTHLVAALNGVSNPASQIGPLDIVVDTWYDIAVVWDGATKSAWLNGNKTGEVAATGTANIPATAVYIGQTVGGASRFTGDLDFLHIAKCELKPAYRPIPAFVIGQHGFETGEDWYVGVD